MISYIFHKQLALIDNKLTAIFGNICFLFCSKFIDIVKLKTKIMITFKPENLIKLKWYKIIYAIFMA